MSYPQLLSLARAGKKFILDLFFPINCLGCEKDGVWLCDNCLSQIKRSEDEFKDWLKPNFLDQIIISADYNDKLLNQALHCFKYKFIEGLGRDLSGLVEFQHIEKIKEYTLISIPLHKKRLRFREFNQAEIIAREISKKFDLKINNKILKRVGYTVAQMSLKRKERLENVKNIFAVNQEELKKIKKIVLIDDVLTTSATLNEAARVLKKAGAEKVIGLVLAHG